MADASTQAVKPVSQLATASDLSKKLDSLRTRRRALELDWQLNVRFYRGDQYTFYNPGTRRIESVPTADGEMPRYRVRITSNQVQTGVQSLLSKIIKTKPIWGATPGQPGDKAIKAAQFSADLLEAKWRDLHMASKYQDAVLWSILAANGYWRMGWDAFANSQQTFLINPQTGEPITDSALEKEFRAELEKAQIDSAQFEKIVYMGDVVVESMSPQDVYLDDVAKEAGEAKWCFCRVFMTPDDIKARWKKDVKPDAVPSGVGDKPLGHTAGDPTVKAVWLFYALPGPSVPKGRYCVFIEDEDEILEDKPWPWPKLNRLPLVQFKGVRVPGQNTDDALVTQARPLQKQLNRMLSQVTEYFNLTVKPRIWAPMNSMRTRITNEPGAVYEYTPVGGMKPEVEQINTIPSYVFEFINKIGASLREVFGLTEVTEGQLPPNLEAGAAIDLLQEMATDRFAPAILENEKSLADAGQILLTLMEQYYIEPRLVTMVGPGGSSKVKEFLSTDFAGSVVHVEAGSSLPRTRAMRQKQIKEWMEMGLVKPQNAWKYFDTADSKELAARFARDEDHALRDHEKIIAGQPLNPEAMQQAIQLVNSKQPNPTTGQPFQSPQEVQAYLEDAALQPGFADNHDQHSQSHRDWITSLEFESHSEEIRRRALRHYELTIQKIIDLSDMTSKRQQAPPEAPRVTLGVKADLGATAVAALLAQAGIPVDPQVVATEPPLVTATYDSVDKADADTGSPGEEANNLSAVAQTMVMTDIANAKAGQEAAHKNADQTRQAELHAHAVRAAKANADAAERAASQPPTLGN